ncbi:MAG: glycosyltransferase family 4 protein [bacterium]|jgi:glycosyltransferase involved in cell wall biosynthesis|nr:glycosyltransferase family 4 protein [bacterium]
MIIVHATPYYPPALEYGGTPEAVVSLAQAQAKAGHRVYVLTTDASLSASLPTQGIDLHWETGGPLAAIGTSQGVKIFYCKNRLPRFATQTKLFSARFWNRVVAETLPKSIDILHLHEVHIPGYRRLCLQCRLRGARVVLSPHGSLRPPIHRGWKKLAHRIGDPLLRRGWFAKTDACIALCNEERKQCMDCHIDPSRIYLVPHGIPQQVESPQELPFPVTKSKWTTFLIVGRLAKLKGVLIALEAFRECWIEGKRGRLVLCGPDEGVHAAIQSLCKENHIPFHTDEVLEKPGVYLCPAVRRESLAHCFAISDCTLCPSPYDSFGLVVIESLVHLTPVIATSAYGCLDYLQDEQGWIQIVPPANTVYFKMKMLSWFHSPRPALPSEFDSSVLPSWEAVGERMVEIYQECRTR